MVRLKPPPYLARPLVAKPSPNGHLVHLDPKLSCPFNIRHLGLPQRQHKCFLSNHVAPRPASKSLYPSDLTIPTTTLTHLASVGQQNPPSQTSGLGTTPPLPAMHIPTMPTRLKIPADFFTPSAITILSSTSEPPCSSSEPPPSSRPSTPKKKDQSQTKKGIKRKSKKTRLASSAEAPPDDNVRNKVNRPRAVPSKESGGVPSPSSLYLKQALPPPTTLPSPRRILVILDLNGTLLYRPSARHPSRFVQRPHAQPFLQYCLETFHLAIWSSARPQNVSKMVSQLLTPDQRSQCAVIWARDKLGLCPKDYDGRVQVYKRLSEIWNDPDVRASHPNASEGGCWDQSNTVLVDDSLEKGRSEPHNILPIPEFMGLQDEPPNVLPQVHDYLNQLCFQSDISRFMRKTPFHLDQKYTLTEE
ncbi:hypothetical protein E4U55_006429 [Claviceps digitariae]|nr:hypothetical protein E4U55_006429 [Claviceps digitariae]